MSLGALVAVLAGDSDCSRRTGLSRCRHRRPSAVPPRATAPAAPNPSLPTIVETLRSSREAQLEERVRQLEAIVNRLSTQMQPGASSAAVPVNVLPNIAPGVTAPSNVPSAS